MRSYRRVASRAPFRRPNFRARGQRAKAAARPGARDGLQQSCCCALAIWAHLCVEGHTLAISSSADIKPHCSWQPGCVQPLGWRRCVFARALRRGTGRVPPAPAAAGWLRSPTPADCEINAS